MVRAKFTCTAVEPNVSGASVFLTPVVGGSPENDNFYKWTPGGSIALSTINETAASQFEVGKSFYVDFTEVPSEAEATGPVSEGTRTE